MASSYPQHPTCLPPSHSLPTHHASCSTRSLLIPTSLLRPLLPPSLPLLLRCGGGHCDVHPCSRKSMATCPYNMSCAPLQPLLLLCRPPLPLSLLPSRSKLLLPSPLLSPPTSAALLPQLCTRVHNPHRTACMLLSLHTRVQSCPPRPTTDTSLLGQSDHA